MDLISSTAADLQALVEASFALVETDAGRSTVRAQAAAALDGLADWTLVDLQGLASALGLRRERSKTATLRRIGLHLTEAVRAMESILV